MIWAYRTSVRTATKTTPYKLMYGVDAIIPLELKIPSLRISLKGVIDDDSYHTLHLNHLELLDECHLKALQHLQSYQNTLPKQYNQSVLPRAFNIGDLVHCENQRNVNVPPDQRGKFCQNWLGPYIVTFVYGSGAYGLSYMDSTTLKVPINIAHLR